MSLSYYETAADQIVESLFDSHMDLERLLPAIAAAMRSRVDDIRKSGDDYEPEDHNWADNQERDANLLADGIQNAADQLSVITRYGEATTDHGDMGLIKSAENTLRNLKRRMDACR